MRRAHADAYLVERLAAVSHASASSPEESSAPKEAKKYGIGDRAGGAYASS